ncbi:MAG TPA: metal-dependent hydrolase [Acidimicrobiales bacterium]|nr:metal-dependent hydrolase [Acidimicrobiales bacterium]
MTQTRPTPEKAVPTRRLSLAESFAEVPRHFAADDDLIMCHLTAVLSALFPDGEDYFVRSVRHFRSEVTDTALKRQVAGFIGQESVHGREHRAFNDRLAELGYPTKGIEGLVRRGLTLRERLVTPHANLALTAGLEHFTATLAELVLTEERSRASFGHPAVRELFLWHALEESEHKAVAFDVYRATGGSERTRVFTMKILRFGFVFVVAVAVVVSLLGDPETYRRGRLRHSWRTFRRSPLMSLELWRQLRDYERRDFHPDDRDTTGPIARWRDELFGAEGTMKARLTGAVAS